MLESVTVHGPFSVAAIARTCRDTLAGVVESDGRCHGAQISAVAAASHAPLGTLSREAVRRNSPRSARLPPSLLGGLLHGPDPVAPRPASPRA